MSFGTIKDVFLQRDKNQCGSNATNINDSDLKVIMIKDYFNHKQRERERARGNHRGYDYYNKLKFGRVIALFVYIFMAFFQKPAWCEEQNYSDDCQKLKTESESYIITSNLPYLDHTAFSIIECFLMLFLILNKALVLKLNNDKNSYVRFCSIFVLFLITMIYDIIRNFFTLKFQLTLIIRPIFLTLYHRVVRNAVFGYSKVLLRSKFIILLMCLNLFFFSAVARTVFFNNDYENELFSNPFNSMFNILILQTTANFPDIMLPIYKDNRFASLFFVAFLLINNVILLNLTLSVFYMNYKKILQEKIQNEEISREHLNSFIQDAMNMDYLTKRKLHELFQSKQEQKSYIVQEEEELPQLNSFGITFFRNLIFVSYLKINLITSLFSGFCFFSLFFHGSDDLISNDSTWTILILLLNIPIILETITSFFKLGSIQIFNIFELITSFALFAFCVLNLSNLVNIKIVEILVLFRFFRFFQLLLNSSFLRSVFQSFFGCIPLFLDLFCVLFVLYMFFAAFGIFFFGGLLNEKIDLIYKGNAYSSAYYSSNFNDLPNAFLILFSLMIVNNWNNQVDVHVLVTDKESYRIYFALFYFLSVLLCLNIMIASFIEILSNFWGIGEEQLNINSKKQQIGDLLTKEGSFTEDFRMKNESDLKSKKGSEEKTKKNKRNLWKSKKKIKKKTELKKIKL